MFEQVADRGSSVEGRSGLTDVQGLCAACRDRGAGAGTGRAVGAVGHG